MHLWPILVKFILLFLWMNAKGNSGLLTQGKRNNEKTVSKPLENTSGLKEYFGDNSDKVLQKATSESENPQPSGSVAENQTIEIPRVNLVSKSTQTSHRKSQKIIPRAAAEKEVGNGTATGSRNENTATIAGGIGAANVSVESDGNNKTRKARPSGINLALSLWLARLMQRTDTQLQPDTPIPEHCGRSKYHAKHRELHMKKRVVGGQTSSYGEWPWLVTMQLSKKGAKHEHLCGGTLIAPQWVLTAAHCFEKVWADFLTDDPNAWMARVGEHNMFMDQGTHEDVAVHKIYFHPKRDAPKTFNLDIALVKLVRPVRMTDNTNVACLPEPADNFPPGTVCVTAGWGHTVEGGNVSTVVRHVRVPILSNSLCNKFYSKLAPLAHLVISKDMMCAGYERGGRDACQYDSGGPMVCFGEDQWLLAGVISTGFGCARPGFPGIYSRVTEFVPWIQDTVAQN